MLALHGFVHCLRCYTENLNPTAEVSAFFNSNVQKLTGKKKNLIEGAGKKLVKLWGVLLGTGNPLQGGFSEDWPVSDWLCPNGSDEELWSIINSQQFL